MPRSLVLGNDRVHVNFDSDYQLRDFYYPNVGMENHTAGHAFRVGVWVDGALTWTTAADWVKAVDYAGATLVSAVTFTNAKLELTLKFSDCVDFHEDLFVRRITLRDTSGKPRAVRLFFHHDFYLYGNDVGDTAAFDPKYRSITHYKDRRYFLINVIKPGRPGVDQWSTGVKDAGGTGTWRDAEDGTLSGNAIAQGAVDSTIACHLEVPASGEAIAYYIIAVGKEWKDVLRLQKMVLDRGPEAFLTRTAAYWNVWVRQGSTDFDGLSPAVVRLYEQSLLILRTHVNFNGAVLAANDSDILRFSRDTYCYMWPRDAALVIFALDQAGYGEAARRFYKLCAETIESRGFFLHKYNPDGTLGSSWHAWQSANGEAQLPIQEDETALVLWGLWEHFKIYGDVEFIKPLYRPLIKGAADFMAGYVDERTGLPLPSWDLWEERRGIMSFTAATVVGGLRAAANFTEAFGEADVAQRYRDVADRMREGMDRYLWREDLGRFARMVALGSPPGHAWDAASGGLSPAAVDPGAPAIGEVDGTLDSSLWGLFAFGAYEASDPRVVKTMAAVSQGLAVRTDVGGTARYTNDYYHQVTRELEKAPGNPWVICTLWMAQHDIARANTIEELERVMPTLEWVAKHALRSGVLPEQADPFTGEPLSVSPLAWSHATVVTTVRNYLSRRYALLTSPPELAPTERSSSL